MRSKYPKTACDRKLQSEVTTTLCCTYPKHCRSYVPTGIRLLEEKQRLPCSLSLVWAQLFRNSCNSHDHELPVCHEFMFMCLTCRDLTHFEIEYNDFLLGSCSLWFSKSMKIMKMDWMLCRSFATATNSFRWFSPSRIWRSRQKVVQVYPNIYI